MGGSDKTKLLLAGALKSRSRTMPLRKITVRELCEDCGLDRRTFYYHFRDIYDLTAWVFNQAIDDCLPGANGNPGFSGLEEALVRLARDAVFYRRALAEDSQNALGRHILNHDIQRYDAALRRFLGTEELDPQVFFAVRYHCFGTLGTVRRWLFDGCTPPPAQMTALLTSAMPPILHKLYANGGSGCRWPTSGT